MMYLYIATYREKGNLLAASIPRDDVRCVKNCRSSLEVRLNVPRHNIVQKSHRSLLPNVSFGTGGGGCVIEPYNGVMGIYLQKIY